MRVFFQFLYRLSLRAVALYGLVLAHVAFFSVGDMVERGWSLAVPMTTLAVMVLASIALLWQRPLPVALRAPHRPWHITLLLPVGLVLTILFAVGAMMAIVSLNLPEPDSRNISVAAGFLPFVIFSFSGLMGIILSLWQAEPPEAPGGTPNRPQKKARSDLRNDPYARLNRI